MRKIVIGIRRETKNRWECRAPLTPLNLADLRQAVPGAVEFVVQPCSRRVFTDAQYMDAGARISDSLEGCDLVIGVKEVPIEQLLPGKHYMFFSHTHKGQPYNMPLLKEACSRRITLLDYELLTDSAGRRLVAFGVFAGYAGMINCLHGLGDRLLTRGYRTPFLHVALAHNYPSLNKARAGLEEVGNAIRAHGLPEALSPMVFLFTGAGNVSRGAQDIFRLLPHEFVPPADLAAVFREPARWRRRLVGCVVGAEDYAVRGDGRPFSLDDYYAQPDQFRSVFHERYGPLASVIVNGIYWDARFPRLLTREQAAAGLDRLLAVCDISCDINVPRGC